MPPESSGSAEEPDWSFLAPPERLADWRLVLAYEAASKAGVLDALPGTAAEVAATCGLDEAALRAVLVQLAAYGVLAEDAVGRFDVGPHAPAPPYDAMLVHHASLIRRWATLLGPRLRERTAGSDDLPRRLADPAVGMGLLEISARRLTDSIVRESLARFPAARRVLDLGGGHGAHARGFAGRGLHVTLQDLPAVVDMAERRAGLRAAGIDLFAGDFLHALPPGPYDIVLCGLTTNMFDEHVNRDLYRRLRPLIAPGGGLVIVTYVRGRDRGAASFGLQMLVATDHGDAHGEDDYRRWLSETGYGQVTARELGDPPQTILLADRDGNAGG